ncbi:SNW/SKI-interacting protein [Tanacetum coccineum]
MNLGGVRIKQKLRLRGVQRNQKKKPKRPSYAESTDVGLSMNELHMEIDDQTIIASSFVCPILKVQNNANFAKLSEVLYVVEQKAREVVATRSKLQKDLMMKEKERKEQELRALAQKARSERVEPGGTVGAGTSSYTPFEKNMMDTDEPMRIKREHEHEHEHEHKRREGKGEKVRGQRCSHKEEADTEKVNQKVGEETDSLGDGKASWFGSVSTSKANLAPKQSSLDNCSVKIVFPFLEGDAPTSYSTSRGVGEKDDEKLKSDDIRPPIKEQENEVLKALYFGKTQRSIDLKVFGGLSLPVVPEQIRGENGNGGRLSTSGTSDIEASFSVVVATVVRAQPEGFYGY